MKDNKKKKVASMARINTRIRVDQQNYIKAEKKKTGQTEGEIFRAILDEHMTRHPKK